MPTRPQRPKSYQVKQQFQFSDKFGKKDHKPIKPKRSADRKSKYSIIRDFFDD